MTENLSARSFGRVLVALGDHSAGAAGGVVDLAIDLAQALKLEVAVLFVEEEQLFDLVRLPIGAAVQPGAREAVARPDELLIEEILARQARLCRLALARRAREADLHCSFEIRRGDPLELVQTIAGPGDLVILSSTMAGVTTRSSFAAALQATTGAAAVIVMAPQQRQRRGAIAVIDQGGLAAGFAELAAQLAASLREELSVLPLHAEASGMAYSELFHGGASLAAVKAALRVLRPRLVVCPLAGSAAEEDPRRLSSLVRAAQAPLLMLRHHIDLLDTA
ncbi:MAG: hypothetical protein ACOC9Q_01235 [bacterium]